MKLISLFSRSESQQDLSSVTSSAKKNQDLNMNEATLMPCGSAGLEVLNQHSPRTQLVAQVAINNILTKNYFDICAIHSVMNLLELGNRKSQAYKELHSLHCVYYSDMPSTLRNQIPHMINELLTQESKPSMCTNVALNGVFK